MAIKNQTVEVHPAYVWNCDECGAENFERAVVYEFSPEELSELRDAGEQGGTGNWVTHPEQVKCRSCEAEFDARHFRASDDAFTAQDGE